MGLEKDMALKKRHGPGKRGMARRHAKRDWGKHYVEIIQMRDHNIRFNEEELTKNIPNYNQILPLI